jgi:CMP-N-acetylneuraminic acid synthetase
MEILAIIPARGGSKKVPGKNIRPLNGRPMLAYSVIEAKRSRYITRVIVSTDDEKIAAAGKEAGAEVPFTRPAELAGDKVTDLPVFQHALRFLAEKEGYRPEMVVHLRPTAPLRTAAHIDKGIEMLRDSNADAVRSVTGAGQHPYKMWRFDEGNRMLPFMPFLTMADEKFNQPRQQLPPAFIQNGSVDVVWARVILEKNSMTGNPVLGMVMDELESVNVDNEEDFLLAEALMAKREDAETAAEDTETGRRGDAEKRP